MGGKDETQKLRKGRLIEQHWACFMQESLPVSIRPRGGSRKVKAIIGSDIPEAPWQEWSLGLLAELEKLASLTIGKRAFAQELMSLEVKQRQQDPFKNNRNVAEVLVSDLERINKDLGCRAEEDEESEPDSDDSGNEDDERLFGDSEEGRGHDADVGDGPEEGATLTADGDQSGAFETSEIPTDVPTAVPTNYNFRPSTEAGLDHSNIKSETNEADVEMVSSTPAQPRPDRTRAMTKTPSRASHGSNPKSKATLKNRVRILRLRADAVRLKQEAAKREAEAYELEMKVLMEEAE